MDGINISWTGLVAQAYIQPDDTPGHRYLNGLFFGSKRLDTGIPDQAKLFIRSQGHERAAAVGRLGHVNYFFLKKFLSVRYVCSHLQDHPGSGWSPIGDTVPGLVGNPGLDNGHRLVFSFFYLKDITQGLYFHGQGIF